MEKENYTVYVHIFPNGKNYIGITCRKPEVRWNNGRGYQNSRFIRHAISKYGWENVKHEILFIGLSKSEAENKEIELIGVYKSSQERYGYNIANGGNSSGCVSEITKRKLSNDRMGIKNPMYGIKGKDNPISVKVNQYDFGGRLIKKWDCAADVERELNISKSKVIAACRGKRKSANGFQWRYGKDAGSLIAVYCKKSVSGINNPMYGNIGALNKRSKSVNQYDLDGKFIKTWGSATMVDKEIGISFRDISSCCHKRRKEAGGFMWKFVCEGYLV